MKKLRTSRKALSPMIGALLAFYISFSALIMAYAWSAALPKLFG